MENTFVIVGASLAGAKAAETLRAEGFGGRVVLIGAEAERPYERPPLSKGLLLGTAEPDSIYVHDEGWYAEHDVELRTGTEVTEIDRAGRAVVAGGERIGYDRLLLTTGSVVRELDVPGIESALYLRRVGDSHRIREALREGARIVVIGAGWIGLETAAAARTHGAQVTVVELDELPLRRVLGDEVARIFADLHRERGVDLRFGRTVREITADTGATTVTLDDGTEIAADTVFVGIGARPATELAERAGLEVDNGVVVDQTLRSSDPDIYAAGDVANAYNPLLGRRVRVEHWENARAGGAAAARAMLGQDVVYDAVPYFYTDQYDLGMEYSGYAEPGEYDQVVFRGDVGKREFIAFWLAGRRVVAGMNVNIWDQTDAIKDLVRSGRTVDAARLADPSVPLQEV